MARLHRSGISSVQKHASTAEAPVWKSYLAIRSSSSNDVATASNTADLVSKSYASASYHGRKRVKSSTGRSGAQGASIWRTLATPLTTRRSDGEDGATVLKSIRYYWQQLSVNERQQVLFLDDPELVKQLYKLNLSLLCVGLMQRHLKTSHRSGLATADTKRMAVSALAETKAVNALAAQERAPTLRATIDTSSEKTYELLEAMEFMDISTGILTVKTELAEDTDRLFTLVGDVLKGFLTSLHVLTESNFNKLFVAESETINTWINYQRLIAMLVEQLILQSYISHLEREATQQMEQLLLEVSLEDKKISTRSKTFDGKKKIKRKNKKRHAASAVPQSDNLDPGNNDECPVREPIDEPMPESTAITINNKCQSMLPVESIDKVPLEVDQVIPEMRTDTRKLSILNPNALVFQPQSISPTAGDFDVQSALSTGKRKFDEYVVSIPREDEDSDVGSECDSQSIDMDLSGTEDTVDVSGLGQQWTEKQRRHEEDAELEWQLQQVYASTSSLFGWDFLRQCELPDVRVNLPWSNEMLWRTAPQEVVRYFSSANENECSSFHAPHFLPSAPWKYYINPGLPGSLEPQLLPPPGFKPSVHHPFSFQPRTVVSSPDYSNTQYHPNATSKTSH